MAALARATSLVGSGYTPVPVSGHEQHANSLCIEGGIVLTSDPDRPVLDPGYIMVDDGKIVDVQEGHPGAVTTTAQRIDARDRLVIPGLINAHTHLCMTLGRSLGVDLTLQNWLRQAQLPFMSQMQPEDYALAVTLGAIENLKSGNTSICEVFFSNRYEGGADLLATRALADIGIRCLFFRSSNDREFAPGFVESTTDIATRSRALMEAWADHERLSVGVGPLSPWNATDEYWADTVALAEDHGTEVHLHTAESEYYNEAMKERTGRRNVEYLAEIGALGERFALNHCVHVNEDEIALIAESGSRVIHDPTSNMLLADGVAPVPAMRKAGITMGLACDGPACNNTQDMFEVMKNASLLHKVTTGDAEIITAGDVSSMATREGAIAAGFGDRIGSLTPGKIADIVIIDTHASHLCPIHDPLATLVYSACAADVHTVIVGGRVVVRAREILTVDESEVIRRAQERAVAIRRAANM